MHTDLFVGSMLAQIQSRFGAVSNRNRAVAAAREGACAPGHQQRGRSKGVQYFLRHEIYKNSVSSVELGMGMEGQIICIEQCTF